jgi:spermidine/putrescine transport system ATP-binding protein
MVELQQITKRWGGFTAVDAVDLSIRGGEFLTLLGPSGCGKTTLLRMISGFEIPTAGRVLLDGQDVTHAPPYRRETNQVFQSYALFPHLSVRDNVAFGLRMKKVPASEIKSRVEEAVAMVALGGMGDRRPNELSGGQKQRVALARAIVNRPKVLLLDEPLSALDAKLRHAMQGELKRLQSRLGITFVFVTHDQEEALTMSDRIAVMNRGKIEQLGPADEIYHRPRTSFVADFVGLTNILPGEATGGPQGVRVRLDPTLTLNCVETGFANTSATGQLRLSIRPEKINLTPHQPPGENAFVAVVEQELFKGATKELLLRTESGLGLTAVVTNESQLEAVYRRGDRVWAQICREDIVVLDGD